MAGRIASLPPLATRQIKEVVLAGADAPLDTAMRLERKAFQILFSSNDKAEGMAAFREKRNPRFEGR
jgi:enoyl-CoA hydratase/carnithine racemase